jgi:streptomycin 3"-adenylyltransferase
MTGNLGLAAADEEQVAAVVGIVREVLGEKVVGVYLHGSTGAGTMRPTSDLDVLVVIGAPTSESERRQLVTRIPAVSGSPEPRGRWRPVELTVVRQSAVNPWHFPAERELQYGQWDRARYAEGFVPGPEPDPDLALLITAARHADRAVLGPPAAAILTPVPASDVRRAILEAVPGILADFEHDVRNYLLTLARIWLTLATGEIRSKDGAAAWAIERLTAATEGVDSTAEARRALAIARQQYLDGTHGEEAWAHDLTTARAAAEAMARQIATLREQSGVRPAG